MKPRHATVGVRELRQNLSIYLDRVKEGETLTVTEHRQVVAILGPRPMSTDPLDALVAKGLAMAARRGPADLPKPARLTLTRPLSEVVRELGDDSV